jgi:hypothetical protein
MAEIFNLYKNNLDKNIININSNFTEINNNLNNTCDNSLINDTFKIINEGEKIIKQMQIQLTSLYDSNLYNEYSKQVKEYQNSFHNFKIKLRKIEESLKDKENNCLLSNNNNNNIINNELLSYSGKQKLEEARRNLYSIEDNGKEALYSLEQQTDSMKAVNVKIKGMNDDLESSNNLLNQMKERIEKNKKQIYLFGGFIMIILIFIITYKLIF